MIAKMDRSANPDNQIHKTLETDVHEYLELRGFWLFAMTYHERLSANEVTTLSRQYDPVSLYIRGRADRVAIHTELGVSFEWEAKTGDSYRNAAIEILPLLHHISKIPMHVPCLYTYRNANHGHDGGFWVDKMPPIMRAMFPTNPRWGDTEWLQDAFASVFPDTEIRQTAPCAGSGDPYVLISGDEIEALSDWKWEIDNFVERQTP